MVYSAIRWKNNPALDIVKDAKFAEFRHYLDSEIKRLQRAGLGSRRRKVEPLTEAEEELLLWNKSLLGDSSPQSLVDTMVVMNGLYLALRSGGEHRQLRSNPCQIQVIERPGRRAYSVYIEVGLDTLGIDSKDYAGHTCTYTCGSHKG